MLREEGAVGLLALTPHKKEQLAVHLILACILLQNTAYILFDANVELCLMKDENQTLNWTSYNSKMMGEILEGVEFTLMIIFAIICDAKIRRFKMIIFGLPLYFIGYTLMTISTMKKSPICHYTTNNSSNHRPIFDENCSIPIFIGVLLIAIGSAAVRPNLIVFGAEQIRNLSPTTRYFDKLVFVINLSIVIGTFVAIWIPTDTYFFNFFLVPNIMLFVSIILIFIGWRWSLYQHTEPYDSVLSNVIPVVKNACRTWYQYRNDRRPFEQSENERTLMSFLDYAKITNNGKFQDRFVNDVKLLRNAFIIFLLLFPYRVIYFQFYSTFRGQISSMTMPNHNHTEPGQMILYLGLTAPSAGLIGIIILNILAYRYLHSRNRLLTIGNKFVIGMILAVITMWIASGVEEARQLDCPGNNTVSNLSVYYQLPQDILIGFTQAFVSIANFEFAFFIAPRSARSLFMTLYLFAIVVAFYIQQAYMDLLKQDPIHLTFHCSPKEPYLGYVYFFLTLSGIQIIFILLFVICEKKFRMFMFDEQQLERNPIQRSPNI